MDKVITGLFALFGVLLGGFLTNLTQHHKLFLEGRLENFAKFFALIHNAREKASDILLDPELQERQNHTKRDIKIQEVYQPVFMQARVIRLYLRKSLREEFFGLVISHWALHTDPDLGDSRINSMIQKCDRIQEIFEQELSPYAWIGHLCEWFPRLKPTLRK